MVKVISDAHEGPIVSLAYNKLRREIYSSADGDKTIKVGHGSEKGKGLVLSSYRRLNACCIHGQVWDSRSGQLLRNQQGHRGMVTSLCFAGSTRLLFSGSIDNTVGIWTEKGANLQVCI